MTTVLLTQEEIQVMLDKAVERAISSSVATNEKKNKYIAKHEIDQIDVDAEIANWIPLEKAYELLNIDYNKWYKKFRKLIIHKSYDRQIWVSKKSILAWFEKDNINNKEKKRP